jgi:DNA-binding response OmpR family regulator
MNRILLVEDEINVRTSLETYLKKEGFQILLANSIEAAESKINEMPDLVLLDWMLPDGQGMELLKKWRSQGIHIPTILLTARVDLIDKIIGLELGANDYVTKPFEPRELVARIRVQLRQKAIEQGSFVAEKNNLIESSEISLNLATREVFYQKKNVELTKTEFDLLRTFLANPNQIFSREELLKQVWGYKQYPTTRTVDTHILQLRQKTRVDFFETIHGIGYRFRPTKI